MTFVLVTLLTLVPPANAGGLGTAMRAIKVAATAARVAQAYGQLEDGTFALTLPELRTCIALQREVEAAVPHIKERDAELKRTDAAILKRISALKALEASTDRTDAAAVARYNTKARSVKAAADKQDAAVSAFQAEITAVQAKGDTFDRNCAGKSYYERDYTMAVQMLALEGR